MPQNLFVYMNAGWVYSVICGSRLLSAEDQRAGEHSFPRLHKKPKEKRKFLCL